MGAEAAVGFGYAVLVQTAITLQTTVELAAHHTFGAPLAVGDSRSFLFAGGPPSHVSILAGLANVGITALIFVVITWLTGVESCPIAAAGALTAGFLAGFMLDQLGGSVHQAGVPIPVANDSDFQLSQFRLWLDAIIFAVAFAGAGRGLLRAGAWLSNTRQSRSRPAVH